MKSLILFDIDDTLSVTQPQWCQFTRLYMSMHGYHQVSNGQYRLERSYNIPEEEIKEYRDVMNDVFPYGELVPVKGAVATISRLLHQGYDIQFITRRPKSRHQDTERWLSTTFGIPHPMIYHDEVDTVERVLQEAAAIREVVVLVDNNADRCAAAVSLGLPCILFAGVSIEGDTDPDSLSIAKAQDYHTVEILLNYYLERGKDMTSKSIEVGDTVICKDAAFNRYPRLPKELQGKELNVINVYKDPTTGASIRAGVTCPGLDNPRSKYNCFNVGCNYLDKKVITNSTENSSIPTRESISREVEKTLNNTHYIILYAGAGVRQIVPVTVLYHVFRSSLVKVVSATNGEYYVLKKLLFDTEADARAYLIAECEDR